MEVKDYWKKTPAKTKMETQNDGLEKVTPFECGHFWYLCQISGV